MCVQCMSTVVATGAAATGIRAWIAAKSPAWATPRLMRRLTAALIGTAILIAAVQISP